MQTSLTKMSSAPSRSKAPGDMIHKPPMQLFISAYMIALKVICDNT